MANDYFTGEKTEVQRAQVTNLRPHSPDRVVLNPSQCPLEYAEALRALEASVSSPVEWGQHPSTSHHEDEIHGKVNVAMVFF